MPVYKEGKNLWRVRIWQRGQARSWMVRGSRHDAEKLEARKWLELDREPVAPQAAPTFLRFLLDEYQPHAELRLKPNWRRKQAYILATLAQEMGDLALTDISAAFMEEYARGRLAHGLKPVSVNGELRVLKRVLALARDRGHVVAVPKVAALPERGETRAKAWTAEELQRLLSSCAKKSPAIVPLVAFLANTGCRAGEALALTWANVDLERGLIKIWPSAEWQPKSGRPREVPISDALRPWLELPRRSMYVFPNRKAGRYADWPQLQFDRARKAAGLTGGPHTLRHTFASHFLARCPDLTLLAEILGHSDTAVTRRYKHLLPDHLERARNAVQVAAPTPAAELLAMQRWRLNRGKPSGEPSGGRGARELTTERETGFEPATFSLGS